MEKETYKVAKQILDKFAPSRLVTPPRPIGQPSLRYLGSFVQSQFMLAPLKLELNIVDIHFLPCGNCALCTVQGWNSRDGAETATWRRAHRNASGIQRLTIFLLIF